jgi:hypothetical protein
MTERCPGGCECRVGTDDADRLDCGCDGGCCEWDITKYPEVDEI